jgi:hypothetical protein
MTLTLPKMGIWESSGNPKNLEFNCRGQNTLPWSVLYTVGNFLKCRCWKWPRMSHLDIYSTSYGWKKCQESNWQFDSQPLKVGSQPDPSVYRWSATHRWKILEKSYKLASDFIESEVWATSYELPKFWESKPGQFRDSSLGVPRKSAIWM